MSLTAEGHPLAQDNACSSLAVSLLRSPKLTRVTRNRHQLSPRASINRARHSTPDVGLCPIGGRLADRSGQNPPWSPASFGVFCIPCSSSTALAQGPAQGPILSRTRALPLLCSVGTRHEGQGWVSGREGAWCLPGHHRSFLKVVIVVEIGQQPRLHGMPPEPLLSQRARCWAIQ